MDDEALGERHRRIVRREQQRARKKSWVVYPYRDPSGAVVFEKVRIPVGGDGQRDKTFRYRHWAPVEPHGWAWEWCKPPGADGYLYHLPDLLGAKASGDDIWWCEGEKDADRLEEEDVITTSHHGGAGKVTARQAEWFRGHPGRVILLYDRDEDGPTGANPGAYDVVRRYDMLRAVGIPSERIGVAGPAVGKDIFDHLNAGQPLDAIEWVADLDPFREKAKRGNGFGAWGYVEVPPDLTEAIARIERDGWHPEVRRG